MEDLNEKGVQVVRENVALLRVAESLDRSHKGVVTDARFIEGEDGEILLEITCEGDCQLEMWGLQNHLGIFEKAFDKSFTPRLVEAESSPKDKE
jgi:exopolyphosphatase/guanosine-5'-triphosphate,3'-diphosphate pyrophosphatase